MNSHVLACGSKTRFLTSGCGNLGLLLLLLELLADLDIFTVSSLVDCGNHIALRNPLWYLEKIWVVNVGQLILALHTGLNLTQHCVNHNGLVHRDFI